MQYSLKLSSTAQNPAYREVFNRKFNSAFDRKPNQIPLQAFESNQTCMPLALSRKISFRVPFLSPHCGFLITLVWTLTYSAFIRRTLLRRFCRSRFHEICSHYDGFHQLYTDGSKIGDQVASAAVTRNSTKAVRLENKASIFKAELYAITLAMDFIRCSKYTKVACKVKLTRRQLTERQLNYR